MVRQQLLVGGHHRLAQLDRPEHQFPRRLYATDDLDHDIDFRILDHRSGVAGEDIVSQVETSVLRGRADGNSGYVQLEPDAGGDRLALAPDQLDQSRSHVATAEESDAHVAHGRPPYRPPSGAGPDFGAGRAG